MSDVVFTAPAVDDLRRIGPDAVPEVLKKILLLLDNPEAGYPLGGELTGFGSWWSAATPWRVVYRITEDKSVEICEVLAIGERADAEVYAEARARGAGTISTPRPRPTRPAGEADAEMKVSRHLIAAVRTCHGKSSDGASTAPGAAERRDPRS